MVPFGIKLLFTSLTLGKTIESTLERIYERKEINTSVSKKELKQFLTLCTRKVYFTYNNITDQQNVLLWGHHRDQFCLEYLWSNLRTVWFRH